MSQLALAPDAICAKFRDALGPRVAETFVVHGQANVVVTSDGWVDAFRLARTDNELACDFFSWVAGIDWSDAPVETADDGDDDAPAASKGGKAPAKTPISGDDGLTEDMYRQPAGEPLEVLGRVSSTTGAHGVTIRCRLENRAAPSIDTLIPVYEGADWHEREMMEMFGVTVVGHPRPIKLYLPDAFEGYPLRKTFRLASRIVKPWPGDVNVEDMPEDAPVLDDDGNIVELAAPAEAESEGGAE